MIFQEDKIMENAMMFLLPLAIVILLAMPLVPIIRGVKTGKKAKHAIMFNLCAFAGVCLAAIALPLTGLAADATTAVAGDGGAGLGYIGAALSTGLASVGAGIAVAAAVPAAIGLYSDAKSFGKGLIFVALGEGIALYGILISILIINKL